ncbi:hypothetical protein LXL04_032629 [Taraxacum kok-saghyz]
MGVWFRLPTMGVCFRLQAATSDQGPFSQVGDEGDLKTMNEFIDIELQNKRKNFWEAASVFIRGVGAGTRFLSTAPPIHICLGILLPLSIHADCLGARFSTSSIGLWPGIAHPRSGDGSGTSLREQKHSKQGTEERKKNRRIVMQPISIPNLLS